MNTKKAKKLRREIYGEGSKRNDGTDYHVRLRKTYRQAKKGGA
jgi:hypothetical protein